MRLLPFKRAALDKLKFAFAQDDIEAHAQSITTTLDDMVRSKRATTLSSQAKGYNNLYRVPLTSDDALIVEINVNRPDHAVWGLTMKYTPSHIRKSQRKDVVAIVNEILGTNARELLGNAALYEVDVAVDFEVELRDVAIEARDKLSCGAWGKTFGGKNILQALYFGSSASDSQFIAYDKAAELHSQLAKMKDRSVELKRIVEKSSSQGARLRLEDRRSLSRVPVPLHRLSDIPAPFSGFHVYSFKEADSKVKNSMERQTLALAKAVGLQSALLGLEKRERESMRRKLSGCQVDWWNSSHYAKALETGLKATGLFPDDAFDKAGRRTSSAEISYRARKKNADKRKSATTAVKPKTR